MDNLCNPMLLDYDMAFSNHVDFDIDDDWQYTNSDTNDHPLFYPFYKNGLVSDYLEIVEQGPAMLAMHCHWIWPDGMDTLDDMESFDYKPQGAYDWDLVSRI